MALLSPLSRLSRPAPGAGAAAAALPSALLVVTWSSGFVGAELGTAHADPLTLLAWRCLAASALLLPLTYGTLARLRAGELGHHAVVGLLCQTGYLGGIVGGVAAGVTPGTAALVAALQPLLVAGAAGTLLGEAVSRRQWQGLTLGLAGVALVVVDDLGAGGTVAGFLLVAGGTLSLSAGTLLERHWAPAGGAPAALAVHCAVSAVAFVAAAGATQALAPPAEGSFWWAVAWVVGLSTFGGYGCYLVVLQQGGPTRVSTLLYLTPPTTTLWALLMFGQRPGILALVGIAVCAVAVHRVLADSRRGRLIRTGRPGGTSPRWRGRWAAPGQGRPQPPAAPRRPCPRP